MALLELEDLHVSLESGKQIVNGISLTLEVGERHALMGPNGSGKSTLAYTLMGHPGYQVVSGRILLAGSEVTELGPDERAQRGLFLAFQHPLAVPGVTVTNFLRTAVNIQRKAQKGTDDPISVKEFRKVLAAALKLMHVDKQMAARYLNEGFSGGEKKRFEILQMAVLKPRVAVLDETDSGLDIDALRIVAAGVRQLIGSEETALVITHHTRILRYLEPTHVHVMVQGQLVASGGPELADQLENEGYAPFTAE